MGRNSAGRVKRPPSVGTIQQLVLLHESFLRDDLRNRAFQQALKRRVFPGASVLDLGSGSGIWAISAARLGARVVALERDPLLISLIERLARENGVGDRVRAVCGDSRRFKAGRDFDLIVSETIGYLGFDEDIVPILSDARKRLLRRGGHLIPERLALLAVPVRSRRRLLRLRSMPIRAESLGALAVHCPRGVASRDFIPLGEPAPIAKADLRSAVVTFDLQHLHAQWTIASGAEVDGILVWVETTLARGVTFSTLRGTHWYPMMFPVEPLPSERGRLRFRLALSTGPLSWEVEWRGVPPVRRLYYSPLFPLGSLAAAARKVKRMRG
jgi:protein arginine N-methyltransferase 1